MERQTDPPVDHGALGCLRSRVAGLIRGPAAVGSANDSSSAAAVSIHRSSAGAIDLARRSCSLGLFQERFA